MAPSTTNACYTYKEGSTRPACSADPDQVGHCGADCASDTRWWVHKPDPLRAPQQSFCCMHLSELGVRQSSGTPPAGPAYTMRSNSLAYTSVWLMSSMCCAPASSPAAFALWKWITPLVTVQPRCTAWQREKVQKQRALSTRFWKPRSWRTHAGLLRHYLRMEATMCPLLWGHHHSMPASGSCCRPFANCTARCLNHARPTRCCPPPTDRH